MPHRQVEAGVSTFLGLKVPRGLSETFQVHTSGGTPHTFSCHPSPKGWPQETTSSLPLKAGSIAIYLPVLATSLRQVLRKHWLTEQP